MFLCHVKLSSSTSSHHWASFTEQPSPSHHHLLLFQIPLNRRNLFVIQTDKHMVQTRISKLVVPHEKHLKQAKTWNALRGACVQMCGVVKSDQVIPVLCELLCCWMSRVKRPIPAGILRKIKEQVSGFAESRGERLFHFSTGWLITDPDHSLD